MNIDITNCTRVNIVDSCAVSNLLSSSLLFNRLDSNQFFFSITRYVEYECLQKNRSSVAGTSQIEIRKRLIQLQKREKFTTHNISIEDLQDTALLKHNRQLGTGELSSIAFSKKINHAFLTDDQKARKIAVEILGKEKVQTTPHLVGWLFYTGLFTDGDLSVLVEQHNSFERPLEKFFKEVYLHACRLKLS